MIARFAARSALVMLLSAMGQAVLRQAGADEYRAEVLDSAPPGEGVAPAIKELLADKGYKVVSDKHRTVCEIWPTKQWQVNSSFTPSSSVLYPFEVGQLIGLVRYPRKGGDFRNQAISKGMYTLRYGQQPVDGNHVGTSATRDFLLLSPADVDSDPKPLAKEDLFKQSEKASGKTHPAILSLLTAEDKATELPAVTHHEQRELWSIRFSNPTVGGEKTMPLVVELVVAGHAPE